MHCYDGYHALFYDLGRMRYFMRGVGFAVYEGVVCTHYEGL